MLYNANEVESHLALQLVEKVARSALRASGFSAEAGAGGSDSEYERDASDDDEMDDGGGDGGGTGGMGGGAGTGRPELLWNGPAPRAAVAWGGGGGGGHARLAIGR